MTEQEYREALHEINVRAENEKRIWKERLLLSTAQLRLAIISETTATR